MTRNRRYARSVPLARFALAAVAIFSAGAAVAAPPQLRIGGKTLAPSDIADARAYPQVEGEVAMLVTLEPAALKRLTTDAPIDFLLEGKALCAAGTPLMGGDGTILLPCFARRAAVEVAALAKALSGKDPLPESLDDEP